MTASSTEESGPQPLGEGQVSPAKKRAERAKRGGDWIVCLAAVGALLIGLVLLRVLWRGSPVAAPFTRVGGTTHVETAVYASRFWLATPQYVVITPANAGERTMLGAAQCAMAYDAPLLFMPVKQARQQLVNETLADWDSDAKAHHLKPPGRKGINNQAEAAACLSKGRPADANGLFPFNPARPLLQLPLIKGKDTLAPRVVFAAAWEPGFIPDIAVGLALGAHMATPHQEVSLVVVPRYLEADLALEEKLESQRELVVGGVVLGQATSVPDDTRALLRQVLTSRDRQGILKQVDDTLGSVEPLVGAVLTLIGAGVAAGTASKAIPQLAKVAYQGAKLALAVLGALAQLTLILILQAVKLARKILVRARILKSEWGPLMTSLANALAGGAKAPSTETDWRSAVANNIKVIVWLRSGTRAVGIVNQWYPADADRAKKRRDAPAATILQLNEVMLTINGAQPESVEFLLIPVADIELIAKSYPSPSSPDQPAASTPQS